MKRLKNNNAAALLMIAMLMGLSSYSLSQSTSLCHENESPNSVHCPSGIDRICCYTNIYGQITVYYTHFQNNQFIRRKCIIFLR